jgi:4-amino-4-deoxy-L-arabinose transferase-like glycosyltransferase
MGDERSNEGRRWVWVIAFCVVTMLLAGSGRYGYHRDELYFIEAGERLAWGYVDQPPLTPLVAWLTGVVHRSLFALRLLPAISVGGLIVLAGAFARRFEGRTFAQALAALATGAAGIFLALGHLLSTTTFDVLVSALLIYLVLRVIQTGEQRLWLVAGAVAGIGLLNKWTVLFVAGALFLGVLMTEHRRLLRAPLLWLGVGIALMMWSPNLIWQAQNGWPFFEIAESLHAEGVDEANSFLFLPLQVLLIGPIALPIWVAGLRSFFRDERMTPYRFVAWTFVVLVVVFVALSSKPYFLAALYVPLLGAGSVATERFLERPKLWLTRRWVVAAVVIGGVAGLPMALPLLPAEVLTETPFNQMNQELGETYGWKSFVRQVAAGYRTLPTEQQSRATVFTLSYGEAGAIDLYGAELGLPSASSGHNNYWLWGPPDAEAVVIVGHFSPEYLDRFFVGVERIGTITNEVGLENEEYGAPIWSADGPRDSWSEVWPALRHYN